MKQYIDKYFTKFKELISKEFFVSGKMIGITLLAMLILSPIVYNSGATSKLNHLIDTERQAQLEEIKKSDTDLQEEISELTDKKEDLKADLTSKSDIQSAKDKYNTDKNDYTNKVTTLNTEISGLDSNIKTKQTQLEEKKAAKAAEEKRIAEEKAAEQARIIQEAQNAQGETVWIGETGTKYHYRDCRTLKGNKYEITLAEAKAQGREACKVCH